MKEGPSWVRSTLGANFRPWSKGEAKVHLEERFDGWTDIDGLETHKKVSIAIHCNQVVVDGTR